MNTTSPSKDATPQQFAFMSKVLSHHASPYPQPPHLLPPVRSAHFSPQLHPPPSLSRSQRYT
eukprot:1332320-Rhodomonas_salina.1